MPVIGHHTSVQQWHLPHGMAAAQVAIPGFEHMVLPTKDTKPKPQGKYIEHDLTYAVWFCTDP
jgi:hypothetical protein